MADEEKGPEPEPGAGEAAEPIDTEIGSEPNAGLLRRQLLFLRKKWWSDEPLTRADRLAVFVRGIFFVAVGAIGLVAAVANTLSAKAAGMEAIAKMMAEFLLIPIAILGLIIVGFGGALVVRSFVAKSTSRELQD
jgi:hypothetical protein